jgi:hypothetical protein
MDQWRQHFLDDVREAFLAQRTAAERALAQVSDTDLFRTVGPEDNSIAVLLRHVGGNLRSRWTEPFTTDGEKPDRNRDREFIVEGDSPADVRAVWDAGWAVLDETLRQMLPQDLDRNVHIRSEPLALTKALHRSLAHTAQHVGQIILLGKQWRGAEWNTLTIPRGQSGQFLSSPPP